MKRHAQIGGETLDAALAAYPNADFLQTARDIAWFHHEKFDGSGYPKGISGHDIPLSARIVAVADVYDALTSKRNYKEAFSHSRATAIILEGRGSHFDPVVVDAFIAIAARFDAIRNQMFESSTDNAPPQGALEISGTQELSTAK